VAFWQTLVERYRADEIEHRTGHSKHGPLNVMLFRTGRH